MAERRMFSKSVIDSDSFLDMSLTTQALYFHLAMRADDDGFINNPKRIQRMIGCGDDEFKMLIAKQYILPFESGVVVVKHWKVHNYIQKDRYIPSKLPEKDLLAIDEKTKEYQVLGGMYTECIQNGDTGKVRKGKVRLGKVRKDILSGKPDGEGEENIKAIIQEAVDYLNETAGKRYKATTPKTRSLIKARLQEGFTLADFRTVIDKKYREWGGSEMDKYLRPETLFGTKFEGYLNQSDVIEVRPKSRAVETPTDRVSRMLNNLLSEEVTE